MAVGLEGDAIILVYIIKVLGSPSLTLDMTEFIKGLINMSEMNKNIQYKNMHNYSNFTLN